MTLQLKMKNEIQKNDALICRVDQSLISGLFVVWG